MPYFATQAGYRLYYEVTGGQDLPPLLLLHGLGSSTRLWHPQVPVFKKYFRVYLLDFPGHGRSERAEQYSIEAITADLAAFMQAQDLNKVHLMGLSLGAAVALSFACKHPDRVSSLVLQSPVGGIVPKHSPAAIGKFLLLKTYLLFLGLLWKTLGKREAIEFVNRYGFQTYGYYPFLVTLQCRVDPLAVWHLAHQIGCPAYVGRLDQVTAPALIITGQGDITPKRYYHYIQNNLASPCPLLIVPGARHIVSIEQTETYNQWVLHFLLLANYHKVNFNQVIQSA